MARSTTTTRARPPAGPPPGIAEAVVLLRQALGGRATVDWNPSRASDHGSDVIVRLPNGATHAIQLKSQLAPPDVREALQARQARAGPATVFVLTRSPKELRAALRDRAQSFIDLSGAVHLALPWIVIDRSDLEPARPTSAWNTGTDPFTDKSSMVLRVMFDAHDASRVWGVLELARTANVAPATASAVLQSLAQRGLVRLVRAGRAAQVTLASPSSIVSAWTRAYDWRLNRGIAIEAPIGDPARFIKSLPKLMRTAFDAAPPRWALTLQAGASLVAPHATWDRIHLYLDVPPQRGARELAATRFGVRNGWLASPHGKLVIMWPHYAHSAWHGLRAVNGIPIVSDLQLVLDLWHYPLRGEEQARHILSRMFPKEQLG